MGRGSYRSIVMVGAYDNIPASRVFQGLLLNKELPEASAEDIERARQLVCDVLGGLAYSLTRDRDDDVPQICRDEWERLRSQFASSSGVIVPVPSNKNVIVHVPVVSFEAQDAVSGRDLHPSPDPLLLAVKAACNGSAQKNQRLLAAASVHDDDWDSLDQLAAEQYLEWRESLHRPTSREELAVLLGQPNGYQSEG